MSPLLNVGPSRDALMNPFSPFTWTHSKISLLLQNPVWYLTVLNVHLVTLFQISIPRLCLLFSTHFLFYYLILWLLVIILCSAAILPCLVMFNIFCVLSKSFTITTLSWVILFDLQSMNWLVGYFASQDRNSEGRAALSAFPTESWPKIQSLTENPNQIPSEPFLSLSTRFCFSNL